MATKNWAPVSIHTSSAAPSRPNHRWRAALLVVTLGTTSTLSALAATSDAELAAKVRDCAEISRSKARLRCFDDAVALPAAGAVTAAAPDRGKAAAGASVPAGTPDLGREQIERREPKPKKENPEDQTLTATVSGLDKRRDGLLTFTLDNGQIWRQKSVTTLFRARVGDSVTVKKGRFGGYTLVAPGRKSTAVVRIE